MRTMFARVSLALCGVLLATACVRMPSEGPVTEVDTDAAGTLAPGTYDYDPQPPQVGESPTEVVAGFLEAMKATPSRTNVASQFLTPERPPALGAGPEDRHLRRVRRPGRRPTGDGAADRHRGVRRARCVAAVARGRRDQLRSHAPGRRVAHRRAARRADRAGDVVRGLLPPDVALLLRPDRADPGARTGVRPLGDQLASSLVGGLLDDPTSDARITRTSCRPASPTTWPCRSPRPASPRCPSWATRRPSATTPGSGSSPSSIWTMRQEPRIRAVRLTIGEEEQDLSGEATQVNLGVGEAFDPTGAQASADLFGLVDGRVVRGSIDSLSATSGPLGVDRLGVRAIGVNLAGDRVAGVSGNGRSLLVAPVEGEGRAVRGRQRRPRSAAPGLGLRGPHLAGGPDGRGGRDQRRGRRAAAPTRSTCPASAAATSAIFWSRATAADSLPSSAPRRATASSPAASSTARPGACFARPGRCSWTSSRTSANQLVRDIGWRSPTTISVLTDITEALSLVETISADGVAR